MAKRIEHHSPDATFAALLTDGPDGTGEALRILVNEASWIARNHFLNSQAMSTVPITPTASSRKR